ncbi:MAG TPA: 4Fe-4S binding protein [Firmicutes bacterium]|nr:4Fe-4S binding protein [Bacillota bacterium]
MSVILTYDPQKCTACLSCTLACSFARTRAFSTRYSVVRVVRRFPERPLVQVCLQCSEGYCLSACPTGALVRSEGGAVQLQAEDCSSCGLCVEVCPHGGIQVAPDGAMVKCETCDGLFPCAAVCSTGALRLLEACREG